MNLVNIKRVRDLYNLGLRQCLISMFTGFILFWCGISNTVNFEFNVDKGFVIAIGILFIVYSLYNFVKLVIIKNKN